NASFITERMVDSCIACHVRLPAQGKPDFPRSLMGRVNPAILSPVARANLQTAGRQFDAALATYESQFADPSTSVPGLNFSEMLSSYLTVALRVRGDAERAERGLAMLGARPDLSAQLEQY